MGDRVGHQCHNGGGGSALRQQAPLRERGTSTNHAQTPLLAKPARAHKALTDRVVFRCEPSCGGVPTSLSRNGSHRTASNTFGTSIRPSHAPRPPSPASQRLADVTGPRRRAERRRAHRGGRGMDDGAPGGPGGPQPVARQAEPSRRDAAARAPHAEPLAWGHSAGGGRGATDRGPQGPLQQEQLRE